jgi:hypothetical protein
VNQEDAIDKAVPIGVESTEIVGLAKLGEGIDEEAGRVLGIGRASAAWLL